VEIRKLQLVGRASFSVTLPPDWIKEYKLKPSDRITITREDDGTLRLAPGIMREEEKQVKITIDADRCKDTGMLMRLIVGGYIRGCDSIEVISKHTISENHRREINDATDGLMGMGTVESTSNRVMLQSVIDPSKFLMRPLLRRLFELSLSMFKDALQAIKDKNTYLAAGVVQRENEVNKFYWLVGRKISLSALNTNFRKKVGLKGTPDLALHLAIGPRIWDGANSSVDIAVNQLALGKNVVDYADLQKIIQLGDMAYDIFSNTCEAFFKGDGVRANSTLEAMKRFDEARDEFVKVVVPRIFKNPQTGLHFISIFRDLQKIVLDAKLIAEIIIFNSTILKNNLP
jgi:phosphate uptake regulator